MKTGKQSIYNLSRSELQEYFEKINEPIYRADQVWEGLYKNLYASWNLFSTLPKYLREKLASDFLIENLVVENKSASNNRKTSKYLFNLGDQKKIETVLMQYRRRNTLCISCQSGCGMGCKFCATGAMGFSRNLACGEIVEQVIHFERELRKQNTSLTNIVVMGMGEPFLNYKNTMMALKILNDQRGFSFGARRITISTIGILPTLENFLSENTQMNLAISLHAPNNQLRDTLVPINKKYPIEDLMRFCQKYSHETHRRISFEYILIDGVNDSEEMAKDLADLVGNLLCHVNLIPYNLTNFYQWKTSSKEKMNHFKSILENNKIPTSIRESKGAEIQAGCGQLAAN